MDQAAIETAKLLGTGSAQIVLAVFAVGLAIVCVWLGRALFAEIKACSAQLLAITEKKIESDNRLSDAIEGSIRVTEAALNAMRKP